MASQPADLSMHFAALRHFERAEFAEAAALCRAILDRSPHDWPTLYLLGAIRNRQSGFDQAARLLAAALQAAPPHASDEIGILKELGQALVGMQDYAAALDCYRRAAMRDPHDIQLQHNIGSALVALNRHAEALAEIRRARAVAPDSADLRLNEGLVMLALGMWPEAWEQLDARLAMPQLQLQDWFPSHVPHWRGEADIAGKTILIQAEQGFGDTLQYLRYVKLVAERGARVVLRIQPELGKLLAGLPGADRVITYADPVPDVDLQCPLMSLPMALGTRVTNVPATVPYVRAQQEYLMLWQALLGLQRRRRIGIVWSARQYQPLRVMPLATLAPLLARPDVEFHTLQQEIPEADRAWLAAHPDIVDHSAELKDFADTAAIVSLLDLVVSIDTAVAHLAGALGKPLWLMLPFSADARWLIGRSDTPWYPTARLFRQRHFKDWDGVVAEITQALSE